MAEISEKEREAIGKQARELLEKFGKALESVKLKEKKKESKVGGFRVEGEGKQGDKEFRRIMFENAPAKEGDNIIAEKKKW